MNPSDAVTCEMRQATEAVAMVCPGKKVWIDLDNSPHVPFFAPIVRELEARGCSIVLTARDAALVTP